MATNYLKGNSPSLPPPRRGKIMWLILEDFMHKNDQDHNALNSQKAKPKTTINLFTIKGSSKVPILEQLVLKLKGKDEALIAPKRKNSSLPARRGMIKVRILEELLQRAAEDGDFGLSSGPGPEEYAEPGNIV